MKFIPPLDTWLTSHYVDVPNHTIEAIGQLDGKRVLDVGCGDMLSAFGLLNRGASEVVALDVKDLGDDIVDNSIARLSAAGFLEAASDRCRLKPTVYDGNTIPFDDDSFDVVFSWGVFEHVSSVRRIILEMKRVLRVSGVCYIKVFPWFHCFYGSHLSDFIDVPFAHLKLDDDEMLVKINGYLDEHPDVDRNLILNHVWPEYLTLNRYSANMFFEDVRFCRFRSSIWRLISYQHELAHAPPGFSLSDLMVAGCEVILRK